MAKKRKAPKSFEQSQATKSTKFDIEERFDDSEDEFYAGREKILLEEGADSKRRRRIAEQERDLQPSDEEILGYEDGDDIDSEDGAELDGSDIDDYDDDQIEDISNGKVTSSKRQGSEMEDDELSEDEHWGTNRADYYNADVIETEADAIEEENEARRLHQKQMKNMTEADFGFDENEWAGEKQETKQSKKSIVEKLPEAQIPAAATEQQKLQILRSRYPELQPLASDFMKLQTVKENLDAQASETLQKTAQGKELGQGIPVMVKRDALAAYLAAISTYFVILSSRISTTSKNNQTITAIPPLELHEHAIIRTLAKARELWDRVANEETAILIPIAKQVTKSESQEGKQSVKGHAASTGKTLDHKAKSKPSKKKLAQRSVSPQSLEDIDMANLPTEISSTKKTKKSKKTNGKGKHVDLDTLMNAAATEDVSSDSDYGDEQPLTEEQYAEKDRKRKSLRFYTSQIASKANKRGHASRVAGGDDDLPYKERNRDRQERLIKAAEAKGRAAADTFEDMEGDELEGLTGQRRRDENDEYYDTLLNATTRKKADKKAKAEAYAVAAQEGAQVYEEETVGADGKRAITYAIAKNKGLAPRRKKEVRNPRVKKRKKFDEKMKKLGSMRQVYKGGEGRGGYSGELTGIKTNVVKSVKL